MLLARATNAGRMDQMAAFGIIGLSLIALYSASTLYHLLPLSPASIAKLRRVDHMAIFVLIAGTYTPFCLLALDGAWRMGLLGVIWVLAVCGVSFKLFWMGATRWLSVVLYLGMGWVAVIAAPALLRAVPAGGWLGYLPGASPIALERWSTGSSVLTPVPGVFGFHELWHLFVVAGRACHFWAVLRYLMVRSLGADHVIDYTKEDFTQSGHKKYDLTFQLAGTRSPSECRRSLSSKGTLVQISGESDDHWIGPVDRIIKALVLSPIVSQKMASFTVQPNNEDLQFLRQLCEDSKLQPVIDRAYPLSETPEAIRYLENRHARGKVVITVSGEEA